MDWTAIINQFGVAVAVLAAVLWGVWQTAIWMAENVAKPIVNAHREYLIATKANAEKIAADLADANDKRSQHDKKVAESLDVIRQTNVESAGSLAKIAASLPTICQVEKKC